MPTLKGVISEYILKIQLYFTCWLPVKHPK